MNRMLILWALSLAVVGVLASVVTAQGLRFKPGLVSGPDLGFQAESMDRNGVVGRFVVKIDGTWVPVSNWARPSPATTSR